MKFSVVQLCSFLLLAVTGPVLSDECLPQSVDLLEGVIPRTPYPQERSPSPMSYAHLINSESKGYVIVNQSLASRINRLSCSTQEIAVSVNVVLLREGLQPIIQIANPRHDLEGEMLLIAIDATKGTLMLSYHHQGSPQVLHLPYELPTRKWRHLVFVFSHNQFKLVQDCSIILMEAIPTPDLCLSKSVTVSVGEVTYSNRVSILQGALQNVNLIFGNGGYTTVCPKLDTSCGTCAEVRQLKQRISALEKEKKELQSQIDELQRAMGVGVDSELFFQDYDFFKDFKNHSFVTNVLSRSPLLSGVGDDKYNCIVQQQMHSTGEFFFHTFDETLMDVCCMCFFGKMICKGNVQREKGIVPACSTVGLPLNTVKTSKRQIGSRTQCTVDECGSITDRGPFNLDKNCQQSQFDDNVCNNEMHSDRNKRLEYHAAVCCGICNPCKAGVCPDGIECETDLTHGNHSCLCPEGKRFDGPPSEQCTDINECMNRTVCPSDSTCVNKDPGYICNCSRTGYRWDKESNMCLDIDECKEGATCPTLRDCVNTDGGHTCNCSSGFKENVETGNCEVQCTPECQNGGTCVTGNICLCPGTGFTGSRCETDIDECKDGNPCSDNQECLNTVGSYVCRCKSGYQSNGTACKDIDECAHGSLHHCDKGSCKNVDGSYQCRCNLEGMPMDCKGMCHMDRNTYYTHNETFNKTCKLCVCMHGMTVCSPLACDCSDFNTANSQCCRQECRSCTLPDGTKLSRGTSGTTLDGCTTCRCRGNGDLECVNMTCPSIDSCPEYLRHTPDGVCCPTCKVPTCNVGQSMKVTIDNGCRECSCNNGKWTCGSPKTCPDLSCADEDRVYEPGQCCPKCRALTTELGGASCP